MRRFLPFIVLGAVTLCVAAALLAYFLPSISFFLVPAEVKQAVADSLECGDGTCAAINIRVRQAPIDATDQSNGIEARWCVAYMRIEENTGSLTREYLPWAYQTAKSYRFILEKTHGSYEPVSFGRGSDGDPERYDQYCQQRSEVILNATALSFDPQDHTFLVTGGAGFIGSHIVRRLVGARARVRVLDNFSTGRRANLADRIELIEGDIAGAATVRRAVDGVDYVLHLAALASVPESVEHPNRNFEVNYLGMHNLLMAAREAQVQRLVFSSSAAVYGDHPAPHHEELAPRSLSPYAAAKHNGEQLCRAFAHVYGLPTVCLRYFNVFGPGQNPRSGYAAAIPIFMTALLEGQRPTIYGDGRQSRDFVHIANIVDANLLACGAEAAIGGVFNVAAGVETDLLELLAILSELASSTVEPIFAPPRVGDIRRSYADISRATATLGFRPRVGLAEGLHETFAWYREHGASF